MSSSFLRGHDPYLSAHPVQDGFAGRIHWIENRIRPIALGRNNRLFAGSMHAGQRAVSIMSLIGSAKMNGLDPYAYLRDVLERLPIHPARRIDELLPHRWRPADTH